MTSREEILANFQACTGIDDVTVAITQLEDADWVLVDAVNKALPGSPPAPSNPAASAPSAASAQTEPPAPPARTDSAATAGTSASAASAWEPMLDDDSDVAPPLLRRGSSSAAAGGGPAPNPPATTASSSSSSSNPFMAFQSTSASSSGLMPTSVASDLYAAGPSSSASSSFGARFRMLDFYITHGDNTIHLKVPDNEDVKMLKTLIQGETGCPPCQQSISGFKGSSGLPPTDRRRLSEMNLPKENFLRLRTPEADVDMTNGEDGAQSKEEAMEDFRLVITNETNNESYTLNFRPTQSVLNIKLDVATLTDIPVSKQMWTGWPKGISDDLSLAQIGIPNEHHLTVDRAAPAPRNMPVLEPEEGTSGQNSRQNSQSRPMQDSDDDYEDAASEVVMDDDDFFANAVGASGSAGGASGSDMVGRRQPPLIPDDYGDEVMASLKFAEEFSNRYGGASSTNAAGGPSHPPNFFPGSLSDAIRESCQQSAKKRKMLAIYLHHDSSVLSNVFCTQALCADSVAAFLDENFVTFGWDVSLHSNKQRCIQMLTEHFGSIASTTVRNLDIDRFPLLALVYKLRGTMEIFQIIHGNVTLDELMSQLLSATETFSSQLAVEIQEEEEREARDAVKREQDLAFEMAQHADREKEAQKQREAAEKAEEERKEEERREREERRRKKEEQEKEERRKKIALRVPAEPDPSVRHARIRFRCPVDAHAQSDGEDEVASASAAGNGEKSKKRSQFERRFLPTDTLAVLFDFLASEGFPTEEHKVLSSWPRRDLTTLDPTSTLEDLKLFPQETLTLEEK